MTADFEIPATQPNLSLSLAAGWRLGQMPQWLDGDTGWTPDAGWVDGDIGLEVVHHAQIFRPYAGKSFNRCVRWPRSTTVTCDALLTVIGW